MQEYRRLCALAARRPPRPVCIPVVEDQGPLYQLERARRFRSQLESGEHMPQAVSVGQMEKIARLKTREEQLAAWDAMLRRRM